MALIGVGHFFSHFYILILPPLFPLLKDAFAVSYLQLGLALGVLNLTTALTQAPVGFLVDRFGPRLILMSGLGLFAAAIAMVGLVPSYPALILFMILGGLGNSVFHPADYSILSNAIDDRRMGRAFSIHTFAGFVGFAAAPPVVVALTALIGWQGALVVSGALGLVVTLVMALNREALVGDDETSGRDAAAKPGASKGGIELLFSPPMLIGLSMFMMLAISHGGLTSFSVAALEALYDLPLAAANAPLTAYLVATTIGVLAGGWMADRTRHQDRVVAVYLVLTALAMVPIALFTLPVWTIALLTGIAGLFSGAIAPSRDMMVRAMTPSGSSGKVFGFVTSGFNIGGIITPFLFGAVMDHGDPRFVFWLVAAFSLLTLATVFTTGRQVNQATNPGSRAGKA